jgi:hypothetical protein
VATSGGCRAGSRTGRGRRRSPGPGRAVAVGEPLPGDSAPCSPADPRRRSRDGSRPSRRGSGPPRRTLRPRGTGPRRPRPGRRRRDSRLWPAPPRTLNRCPSPGRAPAPPGFGSRRRAHCAMPSAMPRRISSPRAPPAFPVRAGSTICARIASLRLPPTQSPPSKTSPRLRESRRVSCAGLRLHFPSSSNTVCRPLARSLQIRSSGHLSRSAFLDTCAGSSPKNPRSDRSGPERSPLRTPISGTSALEQLGIVAAKARAPNRFLPTLDH